MTVVLLSLASALTFGGMSVAVRFGMRGEGGGAGVALATATVALVVVGLSSLVRHDYANAWKFFLVGILAPGLSQSLFTLAIRELGASRTSVAVGTAPLFAVVIAFVFLDEPVRPALVVGSVAIVAGGVMLASERGAAARLRLRGLGYAMLAAVLFATRDNIARALHTEGSPETVAAATMLAGVVVSFLLARRPPTRRELRRLAPAGVLFGLSYVCLFEAYFHGRVSVVSPLVATEALWGVLLAAVVFRGKEQVGRFVLLGAAAVVAGGVLIGAASS